MNTITTISEKEFLKKVADGVSKEVIWKKPFLLLTKNGADNNYMLDALKETYKSQNINTDPSSFEFVRIDDKLEMSLNGVIVDGHHPDVDICIADKDCSIENIPDWMYDKFDIGMIKLDFSSYSGK